MSLALIFTLGEEVYGLEIDLVQEILDNPAGHFVPRAEGALLGAINFHGRVLAVIDLPALLGFAGDARDHRQVVLTPECRSLALVVSGIERIVRLDLSNLQPPPAETGSAIRGVADLDGVMVNMLDTAAVIRKLEHIYSE